MSSCTSSGPRVFIIGAGSRGNAYAKAITAHTNGVIVGVSEPIDFKRRGFIQKYNLTDPSLICSDWKEALSPDRGLGEKVDGVVIATLDETHAEILLAIRPLNLHILCEKPLATTLPDVRHMQSSLLSGPPIIFALGHVLRYSPHNQLLYRLLQETKVIGDILTITHTEPIGHWHFAHSYVRGNWRSGAPSLLTKCCHDIDLLLWLSGETPTKISSHGSLSHFKRSKKPIKAGEATRCKKCPARDECLYSAERVYLDRNLRKGNLGWPGKIVCPEIEDAPDLLTAEKLLVNAIDNSDYGHCVYESPNDVVDNQVVLMTLGEDITATLTMTAFTEKICERLTTVYGTRGELRADSKKIEVVEFMTGETRCYMPEMDLESGHGGGDAGLARGWVQAMEMVGKGEKVEEAQKKCLGCTPEEAVRSHEVVWWAEEARIQGRTMRWDEWVGK
ncbi:hypothetical protein FPQ18DRAFT_252514 [Pyronema domesticum]|uniref:Similar to Putative oxidoreductase YteT acc. no. O34371 n=1 Tax=Pyronema omphalodes (strain CBS 100304) TaxID=1076935 RepID=U4L158_PYROM|nr:hypothetical protein FPQ18DRAFT_252514 [Pyronema domesticum]CCX08744.1 Similar to Putative oxidoreductase YteT; acc. no. O34371 [Pyronema omphalodes CBS 100304]